MPCHAMHMREEEGREEGRKKERRRPNRTSGLVQFPNIGLFSWWEFRFIESRPGLACSG